MRPLDPQDLVKIVEEQARDFGAARKPRILVVEDDETSRLLLCTVLSNFGTCEIVSDGQLALQAYHAALDEGRPFDLICLDIKLPGMDGGRVLKYLRRHEAVTKPTTAVKVVVISGVRASEQVLDMYRLGCQGYLMKPIKVENLLTRLSELEVIP